MVEVNFILLNSPLTTSRKNPGSFTGMHPRGNIHRGCSDGRKDGCTGDSGVVLCNFSADDYISLGLAGYLRSVAVLQCGLVRVLVVLPR